MRFAVAAVASLTVALVSPAAADSANKVIFTVPVQVVNVHPDIRYFEVQCLVSSKPLEPDGAGDSGSSVIARGAKYVPLTSRNYDGNVVVEIDLGRSMSSAMTYACQVAFQRSYTTPVYYEQAFHHAVISWPRTTWGVLPPLRPRPDVVVPARPTTPTSPTAPKVPTPTGPR